VDERDLVDNTKQNIHVGSDRERERERDRQTDRTYRKAGSE
jgi:hypothetical protein